jgi:hypothetical protein
MRQLGIDSVILFRQMMEKKPPLFDRVQFIAVPGHACA